MRIDEIDLYGNILINGFTGSEGQILTYNTGGAFDWGTASGGSSGPTSSYFKTSGYNYVICETVNNGVDPAADAIINGDNLINAYALAKTLEVGTKSATNRVVVLLMPGDYDLSSAQLQLDTSFIDLVGFSSNPYDTILRSSTQFATLFYTAPVDSTLKNVHLKQGTNLSVSDAEFGGNGSYLRWENVILSGNTFWNGGGDYGFTNIYGEFKNIKIVDNSYSFASLGDIDGIFDNIKISGAYAFYTYGGTGSIIGTYSNIEISGGLNHFQSGGEISGSFINITFGVITSGNPIFNTNVGNISGYYENIRSSYSTFVCNNGGDITGNFKNIKIGNNSQSFMAYNNIDGVFDNIEIGDIDYAFSLGGSGYITGTFSNITIGNVVYYVFKWGDPISGSFKNITIGNTSDAFFSSATSLIGEFKNITIGNVTNSAFKATDMISGSFKNITIGDITNNHAFYASGASGQIVGTFDEIQIGNIASTTGYFFTSGATVSGTFSNIEIGDASEWATNGIYMFTSNSLGSITGSYKNIKVGSTSNLFFSTGQYLTGTFENIEFGSSVCVFYNNSGSILGTYSNIKTSSQVGIVFASNIDLIGTFENIEISNIINTYAFSAQNSLSGTFKNIKLGDLSGIDDSVFYSVTTDLTGTFENIEISNGNSLYDIFKSNFGNISGTFSNIKIGSGWNYAFSANNGSGGFSGYFKDIYIPALTSDYAFYGASVSSTSTIDNLWCDNRFYAGLCGKLLNSSIFGLNVGPGWGLDIQADGTIIENCKIIGYAIGPPNYTIYSSTGTKYDVQILYTVVGIVGFCPVFYGFTPTNIGIVPLTPNYNIENYT